MTSSARDPAEQVVDPGVGELAAEFSLVRRRSGYEKVEDGDTRARQGDMDLKEVPLPDDVQAFTCGPLPFVRHVRTSLVERGAGESDPVRGVRPGLVGRADPGVRFDRRRSARRLPTTTPPRQTPTRQP